MRLPRFHILKLMPALIVMGTALLILGLSYSSRQPLTNDIDIRQNNYRQGAQAIKPASEQMPELTPAGVPKYIHYLYRDENLLSEYRDAVETCTKLNKDWKFVLWTDAAIGDFIQTHFPEHKKVYYSFPHKIQRSDGARYLIMYKFGGMYMDLDVVCKKPLLPVLSPYGCFLDKEREHQTQFLFPWKFAAMNSAMGCTPRHPFFKQVIDFVFHPDRINESLIEPFAIQKTTGPAMLTNIYKYWQKSGSQPPVKLLTETYFSPLMDPRLYIYKKCRNITDEIPKSKDSSMLSKKEKLCMQIKELGFEKIDDLFITNRTVAIHQFTHLGYHDHKTRTFDVTKDFPEVMSCLQLTGSLG